MLWAFNEITLFFAAFAAFLLVLEIGFRLGMRRGARDDEEEKAHMTALQSALLGLLALLLGFNFAMASSRFDARKALIQDEINSIGSAYRRAQFLPATQRDSLLALFPAYVQARIDFMRAGIDESDEAVIETSNTQASRIESDMWTLAMDMAATADGAARTGTFVTALNEMANVKWKRRAALDNHVPEFVIYLLFTVASGALGFMGFRYGLSGRRRHFSAGIYALLIALVIATILDFDRPRRGFIRIGEDGMQRLKSSLETQRQ